MRPSFIQINLNSLIHNFNQIKSYCNNSKIMAVVKANAYGHGVIECTKILEKNKVDYFGVAFVEEGIELRLSGIKTPILTLGGISGHQIELFLDHEIDLLASSISKLEQIELKAKELNKIANIHIKIDTGMERVGIHYYSSALTNLIKKAINSDHLKLVGISTHFADSEIIDQNFTKLQRERFNNIINQFEKIIPKNIIRHISNSGGLLSSKDNHLDMVRPGRILYGISAGTHTDHILDLKPCLEIYSEVSYFKVVRKGDPVSYGRTWSPKEDTRVVTIPLGYGDGIPRNLSNKGNVIIRDKVYPIVGNICMDQFMVNIGPKGEAYNGDKVVFVGKSGDESISLVDIAKTINTDALEVVTHLNNRLPRKFIS